MRLTTLARKIDKTPNQLIAFLEEKGIEISSGLHGKLDSEIVDLVYSHFLPEQKIEEEEIVEDIDEVEIDKEIEEKIEKEIDVEIENVENHEVEKKSDRDKIEEKIEELPILEKAEKIEADIPVAKETIKEQKAGTVDDLENDNPDEIELIKVKKVKLEGIKVVGKIELPEKPKKEIVETEKVGPETNQVKTEEKPKKSPKSTNRKFDRNRKKNPRVRNRKPLTYEEKLKKEEREKLKERRQKDKAEKLRKRKYYQENIQPKTNAKSNRKKKKQSTIDARSQEKVVVHKNPFKRLWAWLNGKYDRY